MQTSEVSHLPAADDISFDSLEYLFSPASAVSSTAVPWVEISAEPNPSSENVESLKAEISVLHRLFLDNQKQLQRAHIFIGYMQGVLNEKDAQLAALTGPHTSAVEAIAAQPNDLCSSDNIEEHAGIVYRHEQNTCAETQIIEGRDTWLSLLLRDLRSYLDRLIQHIRLQKH